jgi:hypothetical protein
MQIARSVLLLLGFAAVGCIAPSERGQPLYPVTGQRPAREDVAQIDGYIRLVDDQHVAEGRRFEVLPGCHIIGTPEKWGRVESSGGIIVDTGRRTFALVMKPGHRYHVDVNVKTMGGSTGSAQVEATEQDPKGTRTGTFAPATSTADIDQCRETARSTL